MTNRPRHIDRWRDPLNGIENHLYEYPSGFRVIIALNPASINFDFAVAMRAGSFFEDRLGVPWGTAHLTEHLLYGAPNKVHQTKQQADAFEMGTRSRPPVWTNAKIGTKYFYMYGTTHYKGAARLIASINYKLDFPVENFAKEIDTERKVVLAELAREKKDSHDPDDKYDKSFLSEVYPEECRRPIGNETTIKAITVADIEKYHSCLMDSNNAMIGIQTNKLPSKEQWAALAEIEKLFAPKSTAPNFNPEPRRDFDTKLKFACISLEENQDVFVSVSYVTEVQYTLDYKSRILYFLLGRLLSHVGSELLRYDKKLVYSFSNFANYFAYHWKARGFKFSCPVPELGAVLDACTELVCGGFAQYLDSPQGRRWFRSSISDFIFPNTSEYNSSYATDLALDIMEGYEYKYDKRAANKVARATTIAELKDFVQATVTNKPPLIWAVSSLPEHEMQAAVTQSSLYKYYADL